MRGMVANSNHSQIKNTKRRCNYGKERAKRSKLSAARQLYRLAPRGIAERRLYKRVKCPNCDEYMEYDEATGEWYCENCGYQDTGH